MKLEIEITEDEIRSAIERKVRTAIADQTNNYRTNDYIKEQVRQQWQSAVQSLVAEALKDSPALREKIAEDYDDEPKYVEVLQQYKSDPCAATCRAIVRAAAMIGGDK